MESNLDRLAEADQGKCVMSDWLKNNPSVPFSTVPFSPSEAAQGIDF